MLVKRRDKLAERALKGQLWSQVYDIPLKHPKYFNGEI